MAGKTPELRYGPNGESLIPGTAAYEKGSKVRPVLTNTGTSSSYPSFAPNVPGIQLPGLPPARYASPDEAKDWFKYLPTKNKSLYNDFVADLARKGIAKKYAQAVWNDAVGWTQSLGSTSGNPFEYLNVMDPSMYRAEGTGPKYGTQAVKDTRVTQYSGSSAAQQINDEMERRLGRRATQAEINAYTAGVNAAAKKEPSTYQGSTTTAAPKGKNTMGSSTSTGTQNTGFDPTMFARNFAMSRPDYAESFAANTFLGLVEKLLKDPNAIGNVVGS